MNKKRKASGKGRSYSPNNPKEFSQENADGFWEDKEQKKKFREKTKDVVDVAIFMAYSRFDPHVAKYGLTKKQKQWVYRLCFKWLMVMNLIIVSGVALYFILR